MDFEDPSVPIDMTDAFASAGRAVALCCNGDVERGLALYRQALLATGERGNRARLPVGLHLQLLRNAGLTDVADSIRRDALTEGQNVSIAAALNKPRAEVAADYRALFQRGVVNAQMVANYLLSLSGLGRTDEMAPFLDVDRLVRQTIVPVAADDAAAGRYWAAVAATLLDQRTTDTWQVRVQSVREMHYVSLAAHPNRRIQDVLGMLREEVVHYLADLRSGAGSVPAMIPDAFDLSPWALISSGTGYNAPHIHNKGCVTGVLYVAGPDEIGADSRPVGALRIGAPRSAEGQSGWPDMAIAPRPGRLVLMPSYLTHWTTPLGRPGPRISIAFDVIALRTS